MKSTLLTSIFGTLVCLLFANSVVEAQGVGASGDIRGVVTDPTGRVIPKVSIVAEDVGRGIRRMAVTDDNGEYEITGLQPGAYSITARISGFQSEIIKDVSVRVGQTVILDLPMKISSGSDIVEVTTELPVVETERSHQADTVSEQFIKELPIDRRDYLTFTLLMPGVSDSTRMASNQDFRVKQTPQSGLSFYGSNGRGNSLTVDGGEGNDDSGGVRLNLSQEAVQEFQINRSNYTAELGGASGATINIISKSGSNQVHGSLYGFFRNDALDAADPFAISQALQPGQVFNPLAPDLQGTNVKNSLSRQQFGGTAGFPIKKDRTFLFAAFEGLRQDAQNAVPLISNTSIFRPNTGQGAIFAGLTAVGNGTSVPCLSGPVGAAVAKSLGLPAPNPVTMVPAATCAQILGGALTLNPAASPLSAYIINQLESNGGVFPYNTHRYQASGRLDHHFNDANQVFLRYSYSRDLEESPDVTSLTGFTRGSSIHNYDHTIHGAWYHLFSQSTQNALQVQWNYNNFDVIPNVPGQAGLDIPGFANLGTQIFLPSLTIMRRPSVGDDLTMIRGRHTMKFGGLELLRGNHSESHTFFPGRFVFGLLPGNLLSPCLSTPVACTLPGTVNPAGINSIQSSAFGLPQFYQQGFDNPNYDYPRNFAAFYAQDSWKITPNFTLNYGLRYELDSQYGPLKADKDNVAPRVSFAWDPFKNHKTVIRGGYGIFHSQIYGQIGDVIQTLGLVNGFRQIAQIFVPLTGAPGITPPPGVCPNNVLTSACIFQGLFAAGPNGGLIGCTTPAPGNAACITPASLAPFGITITHTGPVPPLTVIFSGQPNYQNPYAQQASLGIEREIATGFSLSVSGIYSHTLRLPVAIDVNALPAPKITATLANGQTVSYRSWSGAGCAGALILNCFVNPLILQADQYSSQASALFEGGIIEVKKRFSNSFTLLGNYTYSKAFDTSTDFNSDFGPQDNTNLSAERGLSDFDQRHKFTAAAVFDSPWKNKFASGFQLSPIVRYNSGHPFNLLAGADVNGDRHSTNDRPIGAGRNTGLGPSYAAFDMRLSYLFKVGEKAGVQFVAEGFNIANGTNFASVNNVVGPGFGLPLAAGGAGSTTFNVKGTSAVSPSQPLGFTSAFPKREIQLGLRLSF